MESGMCCDRYTKASMQHIITRHCMTILLLQFKLYNKKGMT
jgi:hypothetical protein